MKMLENNNRKFIKTLSKNCLRANRGRNRIAVLAIMLTAILFMALTTIFQGAQVSMKEQRFRQAGTRLMVSIKNLTKEEAEQLVSDPEFAVAGMERYVSNAVNPELNNMTVSVGWADETVAKNSFMELEEGHYPEKEDEIACDFEVLALLGLPDETGSVFTLQYTAGDKILEKQMTVCGIWKGMKYEQNASVLVTEAFVDETLKSFDGEYASMRETSYNVRGSFENENGIPGKLDQLVEKLGYDPAAERGGEGYLIHHVNPVYETSYTYDTQVYIIVGIGVLLIMLAGYLIIYNIFKISIEKDIRLYGQLKTVGASPKQIRYMVMRQGMVLSALGIPMGLVLGWLIGNALLPPVMAGALAGDASFIVPPVWIWLLSGLFALVTVRISCSRPGRIAGKISPVEALKYQGEQKLSKTHKKGKDSGHRIASMAVANLSRNKGKTILVVLSLSLCAVLLNSVLNYTGSMDQETYVRRGMVTDFDVTNANFLKTSSEDYQKVVSEQAIDALEKTDGVTEFGKVYCHMLPAEQLVEGDEDLGRITGINQKEISADPAEFDWNRMLYGMDENALSQTKIIEGSIDYEKLCTGKYVIMAGPVGDWGEYFYEDQEFHAGDMVDLEIDETVQEYTVMAVVGAGSSQTMSYSKGGYEAVVFAEPVFLEKFPDMTAPIHCLFNAREGQFDEINEAVSRIAEGNNLSVSTRLTAEEEYKELKNTYSMVGVIVSVILGLIGLLNLVNVILTGVISRQREFASMRSIGMTKKQLKKLVVYEGLVYAALAGLAGTLLSAGVSVTLVRMLSMNTWFMKYHFTVVPAVVVSGVCLLLAAGISAGSDRLWNRGSIVEQLRECE